jgi:phosphatidylglycerophosphate synthase
VPISVHPTTAAAGLRGSFKRRPGRELACEYAFRPLAHLVVLALLPLRCPPPAVVLIQGAVGLGAAALLFAGRLTEAAVLLLAKTVLDNADGQLARASGRVSEIGRYLDTECDALANVALFAALGSVTGEPWLALAAFAVLTIVLSADFNLEYLYRRERGDEPRPPSRGSADHPRVLAALEHVYAILFSPQDRAIRGFDERRLAGALAGVEDAGLRHRARLAYHDEGTLAVLANFGLSTQLAALAVSLLAGAPVVYLWLVLACGLSLPLLQWRRERRARHVGPSP